jgi:hypothetical protein
MKRITITLAGLFLIVPTLHGQAAQNGAATEAAGKAIKAATSAEVDKSTIKFGILEFPRVASAGTGAQSACCVPGATRHVSGQAEIMAELPQNTKKSVEKKVDSKYSPPMSCWVISKVTKSTMNSIGPVIATQDLVPPNSKILTSNEYATETQKLETYVTNLQVDKYFKFDLNKKIESFAKNYSSYASSLSTSHGTLIHYATLSGAGLGKGRTAYHANYGVDEVCCPPEVRDPQAFYTMVKTWVDERVKKHREIIRETAAKHRLDPKVFTK